MKKLLDQYENKNPEIVFEWSDSQTEAQGWLVINSLRGGAAGGGTRMRIGLNKHEVVSLAKTMAIMASKTPILTVPTPSQMGSPVTLLSTTAIKAKARPSMAPISSSTTTGNSGFFDLVTNSFHVWPFLSLFASIMAVLKENRSRIKPKTNMPIAH